MDRDYKKEYREYHGNPKQVQERTQRNAARSAMGLKKGDGKEVDHKNPISNGGTNSSNNLRVVKRSTNRKKANKLDIIGGVKMPEVRPNEAKQDFIDRCIPQVVSEGKQAQEAVAICNSMYEQKKPDPQPSPLEMLSKLKNWLNKYGYTFDDGNLGQVIEELKLKKVHVGLEDNKYSMLDLEHEQSLTPTEDTQKILVFPRGTHFIQKLDRDLNFDDAFFEEIALSFDSEDLTKPFLDKNHELKESFGDVINYSIEPEGMFFEVRLNNMGRDLVRDRTFKYISPSFGSMIDTKKTEHKNALVSISLTNIPALMASIPALQEQLELENKGSNQMNLTNLANMLNLEGETNLNQINEAVQAMIDQGIEKEALIAELQKTIEALKADGEEAAAATEVVEQELSTLKEASLEKEATEVIDLAIVNGQYHPNEKEFKLELYKKDKDMIVKELELRPKVENHQLSSQGVVNNLNLDADDLKVLEDRGIDTKNADEVNKYLDAQKKY